MQEIVEQVKYVVKKSAPLYIRARNVISSDMTDEDFDALKEVAQLSWPDLVELCRKIRINSTKIEHQLPQVQDPRNCLEVLRAVADSWLLISASNNVEELLQMPLSTKAELEALAKTKKIQLFMKS